MRTAVVALALLVVPVLAASAEACTCIQSGPPCQAAWQVDAVFVAEPVSMREVELSSAGEFPLRRRLFDMRVVERFRGVSGDRVEVATGLNDGYCGYRFEIGRRYLVYAYQNRNTGGLGTSICTRTRRVADASEDLEYLRGAARQPSAFARIFGTAWRWDLTPDGTSRERVRWPGVRVSAELNGRRHDATTGRDGRYELQVPTGKATIAADVGPGLYAATTPIAVEVRDLRACVMADVHVHSDGRIRGRVVDTEGRPIAHLPLELVWESNLARRYVSPFAHARTDEFGDYQFERIPPGRFVVGMHLRTVGQDAEGPSPVRLRAAGSDHVDVVEVGVRQVVFLDDLVVPEELSLARIDGVVVDDAGRPVHDAAIYLRAGGERTGTLVGASVKTDAQGRFRLMAVSGAFTYVVIAERRSPDGASLQKAQSLPFELSSDPVTLRLVFHLIR